MQYWAVPPWTLTIAAHCRGMLATSHLGRSTGMSARLYSKHCRRCPKFCNGSSCLRTKIGDTENVYVMSISWLFRCSCQAPSGISWCSIQHCSFRVTVQRTQEPIFPPIILFVSLLTHFWLIHFFHLHLLYQPLSSYMCSITPETAKVGSSCSHTWGPGIGCWFSDHSNCSHWSFEAA